MDLNTQKEQFSIAYVRAVAAVAGVKVLRSDIDDDSIDIGLERSGGCAPKIDLQLKCTADLIPEVGDITFPLKIKNYNDLRRSTVAPRYLVLLFVPPACTDWLTIDARIKESLLRRCAWWKALAGLPETDNETSVTVSLPRANLFTPTAVNTWMDTVQAQFRPIP